MPLLAAVVAACAPAPLHVDQRPAMAPSQKLDAASATPAPREIGVRYQYYFDRNALASSVIVGSNVIALTQSGHVLRFDKASLALMGAQFLSRRARVMGGADAMSVLVGFEGGRIARLDAASLATETVTTVSGTPMWVGRSKTFGAVIVFASRKVGTRPQWREYENYRIWLGARAGEAPIVLPPKQSVGEPSQNFFLDSRDRLWRGTDGGEWGGDVDVVDLNSGQAGRGPPWDGSNVYGFAESRRGLVLAFGGLTHMGGFASFVANVEPDRASFLYKYDDVEPLTEARAKRWLAAPEPHLPITHVLERDDGSFRLLSFDYLIETDPHFRRFRRIHDFSLRYTPGRPDAVGDYPAVASALVDGERLLLATRNDGLVEYASGRAISHAVADQVAGEIESCVPTPVGLLFVSDSGGSLLTPDGHSKHVELELAQDSDVVLAEPDVPITDSDVLAARNAYVAWVRRIPFTLPGVDGAVVAFARDEVGRLWLGGEGLWVVGKDGRAVAVHPKLDFMTDTVVRRIAAVDGKLVLSLGDRGAAVVEVATP